MSDHEAFMRTIVESPEDDAPRLVYADYLQEHGEADRAEFIRIQCELARTPEYESHYAQLWDRESELLTLHREEWELAIPIKQAFRRGFVEHLTLTDSEFMTYLPRLVDKVPISELHFQNFPLSMQPFLGARLVEHIRGIELIGIGGIPAHIVDFGPIEIGNIKRLTARANRINPLMVPRVTELLRLTDLEYLDLSDNPLHIEGVARLAQWESMKKLSVLRLNQMDAEINYANRMRAPGIAEMADSPLLGQLKRLEIRGQMIGDGGLRSLARSPYFQQLEWLDLSENDIGAIGTSGLEEFCQSGRFPHLKALRLKDNLLESLGVEELLNWQHLPQLRLLDLSGCRLKDPHIRRILKYENWHPDSQLLLARNSASKKNVQRLKDRWPKIGISTES
jgi:uncharacterized protein (TIGR02996 family)